jgi:hypothetical protein
MHAHRNPEAVRYVLSGRSPAPAALREAPVKALDGAASSSEKKPMLKAPFAAAPLAALLTLGACNSEPETITSNTFDPQAEALKKAPPLTEAPPMIKASRTFRCKDNSLVYADFYTNDTARVRTEKDGAATVLTAAGGKPPFIAEGWSLSDNATQVTLTAPGKGSQSCKA